MGNKRWERKGKVSALKKKSQVYHFSPALYPQNMFCLKENSVWLANKNCSLENLTCWEAPNLAFVKYILTSCGVTWHWSARVWLSCPANDYNEVGEHVGQKGLRHFHTTKQLLWCFKSLLIRLIRARLTAGHCYLVCIMQIHASIHSVSLWI